jgi:endonuclease-3
MKPNNQLYNKINTIQHILNFYFKSPPIPLNSLNEFTFLIAVVLSAQTTDGIVNQVTQHLFPIASTPELLSNLSISDVQRIIQPVGLANKKAEYIVNISRKLVGEFGGQVPSTFRELESLPGVGHKTASVVMSQVFGVPSIAVDTHVHRLSLRWGLTKEQKNPDKVQSDLCQLFPEDVWNKVCFIVVSKYVVL